MATGIGNLPNPGMAFTPFDILTAEEMNMMVDNIESLATGVGIGDGAITSNKIDSATKQWSPIASAAGNMNYELTDIFANDYYMLGNLCFFTIRVRGNTTGTASSELTLSLPETPKPRTSRQTTAAAQLVDGSFVGGFAWINHYGNPSVNVRKYDSSNFSIRGGVQVYVSGFYEV